MGFFPLWVDVFFLAHLNEVAYAQATSRIFRYDELQIFPLRWA